jgi:hypothetical protein
MQLSEHERRVLAGREEGLMESDPCYVGQFGRGSSRAMLLPAALRSRALPGHVDAYCACSVAGGAESCPRSRTDLVR